MAKEVKEMVAVRLEPTDRRRLKAITARLQISESDFLRYAIKVSLEEFAPLVDPAKEGAQLLEAFLEHTNEKSGWLDLDRAKLDGILHGDLEDERLRVAEEDIELLLKGRVGRGYHQWLTDNATSMRTPPAFFLTPFVYLREKYVEQQRYDIATQSVGHQSR
jgi:hypothetical protein